MQRLRSLATVVTFGFALSLAAAAALAATPPPPSPSTVQEAKSACARMEYTAATATAFAVRRSLLHRPALSRAALVLRHVHRSAGPPTRRLSRRHRRNHRRRLRCGPSRVRRHGRPLRIHRVQWPLRLLAVTSKAEFGHPLRTALPEVRELRLTPSGFSPGHLVGGWVEATAAHEEFAVVVAFLHRSLRTRLPLSRDRRSRMSTMPPARGCHQAGPASLCSRPHCSRGCAVSSPDRDHAPSGRTIRLTPRPTGLCHARQSRDIWQAS